MTIGGALAGGLIGTIVLTSLMRAANELKLTRIDLPFLLGTAMSGDRARAKAAGYLLHFGFGLVFALGYHAVFTAIGAAGWGLGATLGLLHGVFASTALVNVLLPVVHPRMGSSMTGAGDAPLLEPPGFLLRNYGVQTPVVAIASHVAYGSIVGGISSLSG
jgi:hypothetical protein